MKKFLSAILISGICAVLGAFTVQAADNLLPANEDTQLQGIRLRIDGTDSKYEVKWNDKRNRLLVNSDFAAECFAARIEIGNNSIDIYKNEHILHFETDNEFYIMDNLGGRKIDCFAEINNGKAYLPLRYVCEAFGASVNMTEQTVEVKTKSIVMDESIRRYFENVQVFDQSSIRIAGEKTVYVDPRRILGEPHDADVIFVTHTHNDHYEIYSIKRVMKPSTVIYITGDGVEQANKDGLTNVIGVVPNMDYEADGIKFSTVAAYNTAAERQNHKKEFNWVGYIITINGYTYYCAGDSDFTEEMKSISHPIDVAFLPIDGRYNMGTEEAAEAANTIMPKAAVPYHYNNFVPEDKAQEFTGLLNESIKGAVVTFKMQQ
ncbi:MAG: MBL fold metallo-hydrolase [Clostridia bacterium]|nr:MBL fold metallo-hydrolase [Clostridia bacterium]